MDVTLRFDPDHIQKAVQAVNTHNPFLEEPVTYNDVVRTLKMNISEDIIDTYYIMITGILFLLDPISCSLEDERDPESPIQSIVILVQPFVSASYDFSENNTLQETIYNVPSTPDESTKFN